MSTYFAITRGDVADYVNTLALVYLVLIFVRILISWIPRMPYNRYLAAVPEVRERRDGPVPEPVPPLPAAGAPRAAPALDLSPIVATFVLIIVSSIVVEPDQGERGAAPAAAIATAGVVVALDQVTKQLAVSNIERGEQVNVFSGLDLTNTRNTGVAFGAFEGGGRAGGGPDRAVARAADRLLRAPPRHAAGCGCRWACCSAARSATSPTALARAR